MQLRWVYLLIGVLILIVVRVSWVMLPDWHTETSGLLVLFGLAATGVVSLISGLVSIANDWLEMRRSQRTVIAGEPIFMKDSMNVFVPRPKEYEQIVQALLRQSQQGSVRAQPKTVGLTTEQSGVGLTTALRGAGGYGKTTLAKAVCRDKRIRRSFRDGILWVTIGEKPSEQEIIQKLNNLVEILTGQRSGYTDITTAAAHLRKLLEARRVLLVIDDVWKEEHLQPFLQPDSKTVCLVTTRNDDTLPSEAKKINVAKMKPVEATDLLGWGLPNARRESPQKEALRELAERLGNWALLLKLVNGVLRVRVDAKDSLANAIAYANDRLKRQGVTGFDVQDSQRRDQAVALTLQISIDQLKNDLERDRFRELGVFPDDVDISLGAVSTLWMATGGMGEAECEELCLRLAEHSLLLRCDLGERAIRLHDVVRYYLIEKREKEIEALHQKLVEAYQARCPNGWVDGPPGGTQKDTYYYRYLAYHLSKTIYASELSGLLTNFEWLQKRLQNGGIGELIGDYDYLPIQAVDAKIQLIRDTLQISAHVLARNPEQLAGQLLGRLLEQENAQDLALLEQAKCWQGHAWLCPLFPCLNAPGCGEVRTMEIHSSLVSSVAISPNGRWVVSGSHDRTIKLWELATGQVVRTLKGHSRPVNSVCTDGHWIVSGASDRTIKVWEVATGQLVQTLKGRFSWFRSEVNCVAISPDGRWIVSGAEDGKLKVWEWASGRVAHTLRGHPGGVCSVAIDPQGRWVISGSWDGTLKLWDLATGQEVQTMKSDAGGVHSIAVSQDGRWIAAGTASTITIWELDSGRKVRTLGKHSSWINAVAFHPDGQCILSGSNDSMLKAWELDGGKEMCTLKGHSGPVDCAAISPDGSWVVSGSSDGAIKIWELPGGGKPERMTQVDAAAAGAVHTLKSHAGLVSSIAISPNGQLAVSAADDKTLKLWQLDNGREVRAYPSAVHSVAISSDGRWVVSGSGNGSGNGTVQVWELASWQEGQSFRDYSGSVNCAAFSPDGQWIVFGSSDNTLKVGELASGQVVRTLKGHSGSVNCIAISQDGKWIVSGADDGLVKVWELGSGSKDEHRAEADVVTAPNNAVTTLKDHSGAIRSVAISPDGKWIVSTAGDNPRVWDMVRERVVRTLPGAVNSVAISPNGRYVVTGANDKTIGVWDLDSGECIAYFDCQNSVWVCTISPDGQMVIAGDTCGGLYFLRMEGFEGS